MKQIKDIKQLKRLASRGVEASIMLNGGFKSTKFINYNGTDTFYINNYINDTEQELTEEQLFDRDYTNIGYALNNGALYYE